MNWPSWLVCRSATALYTAMWLVIVLACVVIGWMLTSVTLAEWTALAIAIGVAMALYFMRVMSPARSSAGG